MYLGTPAGYSFFDSGDVELLGQRKRSPYSNVGELAHTLVFASTF